MAGLFGRGAPSLGSAGILRGADNTQGGREVNAAEGKGVVSLQLRRMLASHRMTVETRHKFRTLDGIRGVAALLVVMRHAEPYFRGLPRTESYLAVDLFFVLSGFVLAHSYQARLDAGMTAIRFMRLRFIRLYPLYALGLAIAVAAVVFEAFCGIAPPAWVDVAALLAVLMLPSPVYGVPAGVFPLNGPSWSLFFELMANAVMGAGWRVLTNRVLAVACVAFGASLISVTINLRNANFGDLWITFPVGFDRTCFSFFVGVLLYRLHERVPLRFNPWFVLALAGAALAYGPPQAWRAAYDLFWILCGFPLLVVGAAHVEPRRFSAVFGLLGTVSYPVYIIHDPLQRLIRDVVRHEHSDVTAFAPMSTMRALPFLSTWLSGVTAGRPRRGSRPPGRPRDGPRRPERR